MASLLHAQQRIEIRRGYTVNVCRPVGSTRLYKGRLRRLVGSALDHISLTPEFECRRGHI